MGAQQGLPFFFYATNNPNNVISTPKTPYQNKRLINQTTSERLNLNNPRQTKCSLGGHNNTYLRAGGTRPQEQSVLLQTTATE